jgi:hypothetical protein
VRMTSFVWTTSTDAASSRQPQPEADVGEALTTCASPNAPPSRQCVGTADSCIVEIACIGPGRTYID